MLLVLALLIIALTSAQIPTTFPILDPPSCVATGCPVFARPKCAGTCQKCTSPADCSNLPTPRTCNMATGECRVSCSSSAESCWTMRMLCGPANLCKQCSTNSDCAVYPSQTWCKTMANGVSFCVHCRDSIDCPSGYACDNMKCSQCTSDYNCPSSTPACIEAFEMNSCQPCKNSMNSYCKSPTASKCIGNTCVQCSGDYDCSHISGKPFCSPLGECVACINSTQCINALQPYCDPTANICKPCSQKSHCPQSPDPKVCAASGACVECTDFSHCPTLEKSVCNQHSNICQVCSNNHDCGQFPSKAFCSMTSIGCTGCSSDSQCGDITKFYCDAFDTTCKIYDPPIYLSPEELKKIETMSVVANTTGVIATVAIMLANALSHGDSGGMSGGILAKILQYLKYINVHYSLRLEAMFKSYHSFPGSVTFLAPKIPDSAYIDFPYRGVPPRFARYKVHSSFIVNFWNDMMSSLILAGIFVCIGALEWIWSKKSPTDVLRKTSREVRIVAQNFLILECYNVYCDVLLFFGLEVTSTDWNSPLCVMSFLISFILVILGIVLMVTHFKTLSGYQSIRRKGIKGKPNQQLEAYQLKNEGFKAFFQHFKDDSFTRQTYLLIFAIRSSLCNLIISFLFEYPLLQASLITSMTVIIFGYIIIMRPFKTIVNFSQQITYELLFLIANVCLLTLASLDNSESHSLILRENLCEVIIIISLIFGFIPNLFVIAKVISAAIDFYKLRQANQKTPQKVKTGLDLKIKNARLKGYDIEPKNIQSVELSQPSHVSYPGQYTSNTINQIGQSTLGEIQNPSPPQLSSQSPENLLSSQMPQKRSKIRRANREQFGKEIDNLHQLPNSFILDNIQAYNDNSISLANTSTIQLLNMEPEFDYQKSMNQTSSLFANQESPVQRNRINNRKGHNILDDTH